MQFQLVEYQPEFQMELTKMWRASFERALGLVDPNPIEKQIAYLENELIPKCEITVALDSTRRVVGFLAQDDESIQQLYVHVDCQGQGLGSLLLALAKERSKSGVLRLYTFEKNHHAQRFYEGRGFVLIQKGFEETWQLEDRLYEWRREG